MGLLNPLRWFCASEIEDASGMREPLLQPGFWSRWLPQRLDRMPDASKPSLWMRFKRRIWPPETVGAQDFAGETPLELKEIRRLHWRRALTALPCIVVCAVLGGILYRGVYFKNDISMRYREAGRLAIDDGDVSLARFYYSRLMGEGALGSSQDELNWAMMLTNSGDLPGSIKILDKLAPEEAPGYAPAHRYKALLLMNLLRVGSQKVSDVAPRLQWHLKMARESRLQRIISCGPLTMQSPVRWTKQLRNKFWPRSRTPTYGSRPRRCAAVIAFRIETAF